MSYTPNPYDAAQPTEDKFVVTAAAEFRALKALVASLLPGASYAGAWSALTGPLAAGMLVAHVNTVWLLLTSLADVTTSEPGVTADWVGISGVKRSGDTMTGPLSVPAGASGAQVPQAQEVVPKVGGAARIPTWTTAGRPSSPSAGDTGFNTTLGVPEVWDAANAFWKPLIPIRTASVSVVGSAYDFTGIPAGIRKVRLTFSQISSSDVNSMFIQIGDAGGVKTAGYINAGGGVGGASAAGAYNTTGIEIFSNAPAGSASGHLDMELSLIHI